jgi:hypothetical protein
MKAKRAKKPPEALDLTIPPSIRARTDEVME